MSKTQTLKISEFHYAFDKDRAIAPVFTWELRRRQRNLEACNTVIVGEAGSGKSYMAVDLARALKPSLKDENSIVYSYKEYLKLLLRKGRDPIVFDEPSYAMGKRDWYQEPQKALVKTVESQRFMGRPLFIPIINTNLLDKTVRSYLIQFRVVMVGRGRALVYRIEASQHEDKVYRHYLCTLQYPLMDSHLCSKSTCLGCRKLWKECDILRARYERKKDTIQKGRYKRDLELETDRESKELTLDEITEIAHELRASFIDEDKKIQAMKLKVTLKLQAGVSIAYNKAYEVKAMLEAKFPKDYLT